MAFKRKRITKRKFPRRFKRRGALINKAFFSKASLSPLLPRYNTRMEYGQDQVLSSSATIGAMSHIWLPNSIWDPDFSGIGHQPYGHDQMALFYTRYRVKGIKYKVTFSPNGNQGRVYVVQTNNQLTLSSTDDSFLLEMPRSQSRTQSLSEPIVISGYVDNATLCGRTKTEYNTSDGTQAQFGASPVELMALQVVYSSDSAASINMLYTVEFRYDVELFDPLSVGQS